MEKKILYFDCLSGVSGDMVLGALLNLGIDSERLMEELSKLNLSGYRLSVKKGRKNGISGIDAKVILHDEDYHEEGHTHSHHHGHDHGEHQQESGHSHHRNLNEIERLIDDSGLSEEVKDLSKRIFKEVAMAEAKIHDLGVEEVHFHEVGAVDSIVDIVGTAILIDELNPDGILCSPLHLGTGFVRCEHGMIPVPAPATLEILKGVPVYSTGVTSELVTPTGAAIVKILAAEFVPTPMMEIEKIGYGLGDKDLEITNVLRVVLGKKKVPMSSW